MPLFKQATIIGVGLLGASLGLALRNRALAGRVVGVGRAESDSLKIALERGAIDAAFSDPAAGVKGSDLVVLCTPVGLFPAMMKAIAKALARGAVVTDVGSTKAQVMAWTKKILRQDVCFVGSHPMAGSEKTGPAAAREDLFENAMCLLVDAGSGNRGGKQANEKVETLWHGVGMKTQWLRPQEHDRIVARISHLPHAAAFALAATIGNWPESFVAAGGGYCDTTRIAGSDTAMWRDIFLTNPAAIVKAIAAFQQEMEALRRAIELGDAAAIEKRLDDARRHRAAVLDARGKGR
jgi:prephenate dehydrogenase